MITNTEFYYWFVFTPIKNAEEIDARFNFSYPLRDVHMQVENTITQFKLSAQFLN